MNQSNETTGFSDINAGVESAQEARVLLHL